MEKIFVNGLIVKRNEKAPTWIIASLSFKVDEFKQFLDTHNNNGWINVDVKIGKSGKMYAELNTYKRDETMTAIKQQEALNTIEYPSDENLSDSIPF
jgi:hypothetical protein